MASSTLVRDVLRDVSAQLNDLDPQFNRWTQADLLLGLNDAQTVIATYMPWSCARSDAIKLKPGTKQSIDTIAATDIVPGDGSTPAEMLGHSLHRVVRNAGNTGTKPGRAISITDFDTLDITDPNWHASQGAEVLQYVYDPRNPKLFYTYPGVPSTGALWVEIAYQAAVKRIVPTSPTQFIATGNDDTVLTVDDKFVPDVHNYIMARAYLKDAEAGGNAQLAAAYAQLFAGSINAQVAAMTGVNPNLQSLKINPTMLAGPAPKG